MIRIAPGVGWGTGAHETTQLCLQAIRVYAKPGMRALDFGSGSGILSIALAERGAAVDGVEIDPAANEHARENARLNGVEDRIRFFEGIPPGDPYSLIVANILAGALDALAGTLAGHVAPGGRIALSGILAGQEGPLLGRFGAWFDDLAVAREDDWIRIDGVRRG